jgi:hypothetical protein
MSCPADGSIEEGQVTTSSGTHASPFCIVDEPTITILHATQQLIDNINNNNNGNSISIREAYDEMVISLHNPTLVSAEFYHCQGFNSFPSFTEFRATLYRARNLPPEPTSLFDILTAENIPHEYQHILLPVPNDNIPADIPPPARFLFHFSRPTLVELDLVDASTPENNVNQRVPIMMFGSPTFLDLLTQSEHIFVDGTFDVVPRIYHEFRSSSQVFTFHAIRQNRMFPLVYVLLPGKSQETYTYMLTQLIDVLNRRGFVRWRTVMTDFEAALRASFSVVLGNQVTLRGCYFHFVQAVYRRIASVRVLRYLYLDRENRYGFYTLVRRILALAFLPPDKVMATFDMLCTSYEALHPALFTVAGNDIHNVR